MSTTSTAKEKFGFSNKDIATYIIIFREDIGVLRRTRPWLYENLPVVLGIPKRMWSDKRRFRFINRTTRISNDHRYCQISKRIIVKVILDVLYACGKSDEEQKDALEKINNAIIFFEPVPNLQPSNPAGTLDEVHKEWANRLAEQEVGRIEELIGLKNVKTTSYE